MIVENVQWQFLRGVGHPVICLTDNEGAKHSLEKDLTTCEPAVMLYGTIQEIADAYDMDATTLQETIDENHFDCSEVVREIVAPVGQSGPTANSASILKEVETESEAFPLTFFKPIR